MSGGEFSPLEKNALNAVQRVTTLKLLRILSSVSFDIVHSAIDKKLYWM